MISIGGFLKEVRKSLGGKTILVPKEDSDTFTTFMGYYQTGDGMDHIRKFYNIPKGTETTALETLTSAFASLPLKCKLIQLTYTPVIKYLQYIEETSKKFNWQFDYKCVPATKIDILEVANDVSFVDGECEYIICVEPKFILSDISPILAVVDSLVRTSYAKIIVSKRGQALLVVQKNMKGKEITLETKELPPVGISLPTRDTLMLRPVSIEEADTTKPTKIRCISNGKYIEIIEDRSKDSGQFLVALGDKGTLFTVAKTPSGEFIFSNEGKYLHSHYLTAKISNGFEVTVFGDVDDSSLWKIDYDDFGKISIMNKHLGSYLVYRNIMHDASRRQVITIKTETPSHSWVFEN